MPTALSSGARAALAYALLSLPVLGVPSATPSMASPATHGRLETASGAAAIVSAAIRRRGHVCDGTVAAQPVTGAATAHRKQWHLTCGDTHYRVTFVLDRMVSVDRLD